MGTTRQSSRLGKRCAERIRRYQRSDVRRRADGVCRFDPTCSSYALQAFESRPFLVALGMTMSRLLRCNPLVRRITRDPVQRHGHTPRPGTLRSLFLVTMLAGLTMLAFVGTASADAPTGGCTGSVNGRSAASLTRDNPLKVKEHETVTASGNVPPGRSGVNNTRVEVFLIDPIGGITSEAHEGDGDTWSSSSVEVDDYLKYGVGTYKVEVTNTGAGWECTFIGYVQLDGNPLTKPIGIAAAGMTAVGAVGGLLAPRRKPNAKWIGDQKAKAKRDVMDTILEEGDKVTAAADASPPTGPPKEDPVDLFVEDEEGFFYKYCLGCMIAMILVPSWAMPIFGMGGGAGAVRTQPPATGRVLWKKRVWRRGRPFIGFFSGLLFGIGVSVLLWQYNVWLLDIVTAIVIPLAVAVLFAVYSWIGKPYRLVAVSAGAPPAPWAAARLAAPPAPPAPPVPVPPDEPPPAAVVELPPPPAPVVEVEPPPPPPPAPVVEAEPPPAASVEAEPPPPPAAVEDAADEPPPPPPAV